MRDQSNKDGGPIDTTSSSFSSATEDDVPSEHCLYPLWRIGQETGGCIRTIHEFGRMSLKR